MIRTTMAFIFFLFLNSVISFAQAESIIRISGEGIKNFEAYESEGTFYAAPVILTKGGKWKLSWENEKLYVYPDKKGNEKVEIPTKEINGGKYIDFSFFSKPAGLNYTYDEKKRKIKLKKIKEKQDNRKRSEESPSKMPVILWDINYSFNPDQKDFRQIQGVPILSPVMGSYDDYISGKYRLDFNYLKRVRNAEINVMPLVSNDFEPEKTALFMRDSLKQTEIINRLTALSVVYDLYGFNLDFENMNPEDSALFTDFVKKFYQVLNEKGKKLTIDITVYNPKSLNWSLCYDREGLAPYCDYEIIMGYDETGRFTDHAGSVSSYSWLDKNVSTLITMVPPEKLILGLPFYTRIYSGYKGHIKSETLPMKKQEEFLKRQHHPVIWQKEAKQYVMQWKQNGIPHTVYLEEEKSLSAKFSLIAKYNLGGAAFWRYGFEEGEIYEMLENNRHEKKDEINKVQLHI